jgi:CSLREA domain-containing protein
MRGLLTLAALACLALAGIATTAQAGKIPVKTTTDELNADGDCSLREAVQAANTNATVDACRKGQADERDVIELKPKGYVLTIPTTDEGANQNGDLDTLLGGPLKIRGDEKGGDRTVISAADDDRVIDVVGSENVKLERLVLRDGDVRSIAQANARGAGLRVAAQTANVKLSRMSLSSNFARVGGGIYVSNSSRLTVSKSFVQGNSAPSGGALATGNSADVKLSKSDFAFNVSQSGSDDVSGGAISHGAATGSLNVVDSDLTLNEARSTGSGNRARGGAIYSSGPLTITRSTLSVNATLAGDSGASEDGGGLYVAGGTPEIVNSTFSSNDAGDTDGSGGAIYTAASDVNVRFSTFSGNTNSTGGDSLATSGISQIFYGRSILDDSVFGSPCDGNIASVGFNVSEDDDVDCGFAPSDAVGAGDLRLSPLASNGGPTETVKIGKASPAKEFVPNTRCAAANDEDQRGYKRPAGKKCDAGAYERGAS